MQRIRFITHADRKILFFDFSGLPDAQAVRGLIAEAKAVVASQAQGSLLTLADVSNISKDAETAKALWELLKHDKPYVRAAAVVGVHSEEELGLYQLITRQANRRLELFGDLESAKTWLLQHAD